MFDGGVEACSSQGSERAGYATYISRSTSRGLKKGEWELKELTKAYPGFCGAEGGKLRPLYVQRAQWQWGPSSSNGRTDVQTHE